MPYNQPFNLPSLHETFRSNTKLLTGLLRARFTSVVPVMMIPQGGLQQYYGIGPGGDADATRLLLRQKLVRHNVSEKMSHFLQRQFNSVVDAPISTMHIAVGYSHPVYSPLDSIMMFESFEPHMSLWDLVKMTKKEAMYVLDGSKPLVERGSTKAVRDPEGEMRHIETRLDGLGLGFAIQPVVKLRAVR